MSKFRKLLVVLIPIIILGVAVAPARAQSQEIVTAQVDRETLTTSDTLVLTVAINTAAGNATPPALPALDGFQVVGSSSGTSMSIVNGNVSRHATFNYHLQPTKTGDLIISPILVRVGGRDYSTDPIQVSVTQGNGNPTQPSQPSSPFGSFGSFPGMPNLPSFGNLSGLGNLSNFFGTPSTSSGSSGQTFKVDPAPVPHELIGEEYFLEAEVDNAAPYQGQQLTYTLRFYQATETMGQAEYELPGFTGFWSEIQQDQGQYVLQVAGQTYKVTELYAILFPTVVGEASIDTASMFVPGGFFSNGGTISSNAVSVNVQPLPDGAPDSFQGAVGRYLIQAEVDKDRTMVNDTINWHVALAGEGNIEAVPDPVWPESEDWRAFESDPVVASEIKEGRVIGSRSYDRVLVPTVAGQLTLPPIEYSYFDPDMAEYVTISSEPIMVAVEDDGSGVALNANPIITQPAIDNGAIAPAALSQLQPLKEAPSSWQLASRPLSQQTAFWLLWTLPLFAIAGHFGWQRWRVGKLNNADLHRSQKAAKKAKKALANAQKKPSQQYEAAGQILTTYLEDKLNQAVAGLTHTALASILQDKGVDKQVTDDLLYCLTVSEMGRYAPSDTGTASEGILTQVAEVINKLESYL